jgi:hypothetical protein
MHSLRETYQEIELHLFDTLQTKSALSVHVPVVGKKAKAKAEFRQLPDG